MKPIEERLNALPKNERRVNVGVLESHHQVLKMVSAMRGLSVQQSLDLVLQSALIDVKGLTFADLETWITTLNPEKREPPPEV